MNVNEIIETYLSIVKTKYICFEGTATQQELICYIIVWVVGAVAAGVVSVILGIIGALLSAVWNLGNLLPGIGTIVRFLNSRKAQ